MVIDPSGYASGNWRESGDSITYKPWDHNAHGIDSPGSSEITFKFTVRYGGEYYFSAKTHAAHNTEFNDVWVKMGGSEAFKFSAMSGGSTYYHGGWAKAYQNEYSSMSLYSKDHHPHQMQTGHLNPGQVYELKTSGRTSRFKIERLMLVKCKGSCKKYEGDMQAAISDMAVSSCY